MQYVELMKSVHLELAAEYLVMAALLAEIKSRMLLPRTETTEPQEEDPRAELIRRLQEYEQFKTAAETLDQLPRVGRELFIPQLPVPDDIPARTLLPAVDLEDLLRALVDVLHRAELFESHSITQEPLSTRERMGRVLEQLSAHQGFLLFSDLFQPKEGRLGVVVTFLAILELVKETWIELVQNEAFTPIHVRRRVVDESV